MTVGIEFLRARLTDLPPGPMARSVELEDLLAEAWDGLAGSRDGGMQADKLRGRLESIEWSPPILKFDIERHGGTVHGSTRAELQRWAVDVNAGVADLLLGHHFRQLEPTQPRLDVKPLVDAIATAILSGAVDPRLKWSADRKNVQVQIAKIIPDSGPKETTAKRRKRFRDALEPRLIEAGWKEVRANNYHRP